MFHHVRESSLNQSSFDQHSKRCVGPHFGQ
jgi:hypothetical protein